jgi:hypothetical protein
MRTARELFQFNDMARSWERHPQGRAQFRWTSRRGPARWAGYNRPTSNRAAYLSSSAERAPILTNSRLV